jgi:hypothetical protein
MVNWGAYSANFMKHLQYAKHEARHPGAAESHPNPSPDISHCQGAEASLHWLAFPHARILELSFFQLALTELSPVLNAYIKLFNVIMQHLPR